jgi:phytoene synthase
MPTPAITVDQPEAVLQHHARSFAWAGRLLSRDDRHEAARLYAFCRTVDDLADDAALADADAALVAIREALLAGDPSHPVAGPFLALAERRGIEIAAAINLIDGVRGDLATVEIATTDELIRYAYRVAGTVGLMMRPLLGVTTREADPFAVDLGIAMQLTNIARDVVEDGEQGRRYLPTDQLGGPVEPHRLAAPDPILRYDAFSAVTGLLDTADAYYASAAQGMALIPRRPRLAILTAARLYRAIGDQIRGLGPQAYWRTRAVVSPARKVGVTARVLPQWLRPATRTIAPHDPGLHAAIAGWPGADPTAATKP